jgi:acetoin utilization deacetylase AcuC-like enzyme
VDIDVHHGNGTEAIVRNLKPHKQFMPLPSSWAPVTTLSYKPWFNENDADEVFFASVHLFGDEQFYPCSGREAANDPNENIVNIGLTPVGPGPWDQKGRLKLTHAQRRELINVANAELRYNFN